MAVIQQDGVAEFTPAGGIVVTPDDPAIRDLEDLPVVGLTAVQEIVGGEVLAQHLVGEGTHLPVGEGLRVHAHVREQCPGQETVSREGRAAHPVVDGCLLPREGTGHREHIVVERNQLAIQVKPAIGAVLRVDDVLPLPLGRGLADVHQGLAGPAADGVLAALDIEFVGVVAPLGTGIELLRGKSPQEISVPLQGGIFLHQILHRHREGIGTLEDTADLRAHIDIPAVVAQVDQGSTAAPFQPGRAAEAAVQAGAGGIPDHGALAARKIILQDRLRLRGAQHRCSGEPEKENQSFHEMW